MSRRGGFTLVEVLVALGILALGIGGVLAMFASAAATHRRALDETITAMIAGTVVAEQRAAFNRNKYGELAAIKKEPAPGYDFFSYSVTPTVLAREPQTDRTVHLHLEVSVDYQRGDKPRRATYSTVLFRE